MNRGARNMKSNVHPNWWVAELLAVHGNGDAPHAAANRRVAPPSRRIVYHALAILQAFGIWGRA